MCTDRYAGRPGVVRVVAGIPESVPVPTAHAEVMPMPAPLTRYLEVPLVSELYARLSTREQAILALLVDSAREMDAIFWKEACVDREALLASIEEPETRRFAELNYGPWDRLDGNAPFVEGVEPKPPGARFYPSDMTRQEFETVCATSPARAKVLRSQYTLVRRDADGGLQAVPYHVAFPAEVRAAADKLRRAAALAEDPALRRYLELRASALLDDDYRASDVAWLEMKDNAIDVVIGPIEDYEDDLFGYKAAHEGIVLLRDREWSARLARYATLLPRLQRELPVPDEYKREAPGGHSDLNAYDAIFYAGEANAGAKAIAINLPNDEEIHLAVGSRRLQLKNVMQAKFDRILVPIADRLIAPEQRRHVVFEAFFQNVMFHEVAHGLGIKHTLDGRGTVRDALREHAGAVEEGKADIVGLHMAVQLQEMGELGDADLMDSCVTYLAGIFRSARFGATEAHARADLAQFELFRQGGAFTRDDASGTYRVNLPSMRTVMTSLAARLLTLQGDGDYDGVVAYLSIGDRIDPTLASDLARLAGADIPSDIAFRQGMDVLAGGSAPPG